MYEYKCIFFFFFKQKTAYEVRISDWSSDVCSSDLVGAAQRGLFLGVAQQQLPGRDAERLGRLPSLDPVPVRARSLAVEPQPVQHPPADDGGIADPVAIDQAVVDVGDPEILELLLQIIFGRVIAAAMPVGVRGLDDGAGRERDGDVVLQPARETEIAARRNNDGAAAGARCGHDSLVDRARIDRE